jgi:hypothetical protein
MLKAEHAREVANDIVRGIFSKHIDLYSWLVFKLGLNLLVSLPK